MSNVCKSVEQETQRLAAAQVSWMRKKMVVAMLLSLNEINKGDVIIQKEAAVNFH